MRVIKKFCQLLTERQKGRVVILFFMMLLGAAFEVCGVSLMIPLVTAVMNDNIIEDNPYVGKICVMFHIESHIGFVILCITALILLYVVKTFYLVFEYYVQYRFIGNNQFAIQERLLDTYLYRPYEFFLSAQSGEIVRIVQNDTEQTFGMLGTLLSALSETVVSFALLAAVFIISPMITGFVVAVMALMMLFIVKAVRPVLQRQGRRYQESYAQNNKWLLQAVSGIKEIKASQTERFFLDNYRTYGRQRVRAFRINNTLQNIPRFLIEAVSVCSMLAVVGIMLLCGQGIQTLIPALSAFAMAAVKLLPSANRIVSAVNQVAFMEPALDNMIKNTRQDTRADDGAGQGADTNLKISTRHGKPMKLKHGICMSGITYSYPGSEKKIFDHMDLEIPAGSSIGIVGASGAGKTTAVDILLGLLQPQEGRILADGVDVSTNMQGWLAHVGYIPQMIFMLDGSVRENVVFGHKDGTDAAVWAALEEAQLAEFVSGLPEGLDTEIGERGIRLSGGQRQRIGIARALFTDPEVLVFDEATSALDNETEEAIMKPVHALHGKKTMIIIAHRLTTIEGCDAVYRAENGKLVRER